MAILQTRIFVPSNDPIHDWAETVVGRVIRAALAEFQPHLHWFWFSRYVSEISDSGDCDISQIPQNYKEPQQPGRHPIHRSIRFRFEIDDSQEAGFRTRIQTLVQQSGYAISGILPFDKVGGTGNHRFLGVENREPGRDVQRAHFVTNYFHAVSLLMVDALVGPDVNNRFRMEKSDDMANNPRGSTFQSLHHMFCNITNVPLDVLLCQQGMRFNIGTGLYPPGPLHAFDQVEAHPIRF